MRGKYVAYFPIDVFRNAFKRILWNEKKQSIWHTEWLDHLMECLFHGYMRIKNIPALRKYKDKNGPEHYDYRRALHTQDLKDYAVPTSQEAGIIQAALQLQRQIDKHEWLDETGEWIDTCPESELRSARRDFWSYYKHPGPKNIDDQMQDEETCAVTGGGWTHYLETANTYHRSRMSPTRHPVPSSSAGWGMWQLSLTLHV